MAASTVTPAFRRTMRTWGASTLATCSPMTVPVITCGPFRPGSTLRNLTRIESGMYSGGEAPDGVSRSSSVWTSGRTVRRGDGRRVLECCVLLVRRARFHQLDAIAHLAQKYGQR